MKSPCWRHRHCLWRDRRLVQRDIKFVIGYSSVSHMGFVLLGLMTLTQIGLSGAVMQMFPTAYRRPSFCGGGPDDLRPHPYP